MSKKKTTEEFKQEIKLKNNKVEITGAYLGANTPIEYKCLICGNYFEAIPSSLLHGSIHSECAMKLNGKKHRFTTVDFKNKVTELYGNEYTVIGQYTRAKDHIHIKHNICGHEWNPVADSFIHGDSKCPKCSKVYRPTNDEYIQSLSKINNDIKPLELYINTNTPILHQCLKCGHKWKVSPTSLLHSKTGCPMCNGGTNTVVKGVNDMWTTNPELAKLLANPEDGFKYCQGSDTRVDWKCPNCGNIIKNKIIDRVKSRGLSCGICSDHISYPNKLMYNILSQLNIDFEAEKFFNWCRYEYKGKNKVGRYDFYIKSMNLIIEMDGYFHYKDNGINGMSVIDAVNIDDIKDQLAIQNGIQSSIRIDCKKSELEYIKNSILHSQLVKIFDLSTIDWKRCELNSLSSFVPKIWDLWNSGMKSTSDIVKTTHLDIGTVLKYLKIGNKLNKCDYSKEYGKEKVRKVFEKYRKKRSVICLTTNKVFHTLTEAGKFYNITSSNIGRNCNSLSQYCGIDFETKNRLSWMYYDDYLKSTKEQITKKLNMVNQRSTYHYKVKVICLNNLMIFESIKEAAEWANIKCPSKIRDYIINEKSKYCGMHPDTKEKLQWMYYDEYLQSIQSNKDLSA